MRKLFFPIAAVAAMSFMSFIAEDRTPILKTSKGAFLVQSNSVMESTDRIKLVELISQNTNLGGFSYNDGKKTKSINWNVEDLKLVSTENEINLIPGSNDLVGAFIFKKIISWTKVRKVSESSVVQEEISFFNEQGHKDMAAIFAKYKPLEIKL